MENNMEEQTNDMDNRQNSIIHLKKLKQLTLIAKQWTIGQQRMHDQIETLRKFQPKPAKNLILKVKSTKPFIKRINFYLKRFSIRFLKFLDNHTIFITFAKHEDYRRFKIRVKKSIRDIKIIDEQGEDVNFVIYAPDDIPLEIINCEISKRAYERPYYIFLIEHRGKYWKMYAGLSSVGFLWLRGHNETTISVGSKQCKYKQLPGKYVKRMLENSIRKKYSTVNLYNSILESGLFG